MIDGEDIKKLAVLARIKLSQEEIDSLVKEIDPILAYVGQINDASGGVVVSSASATINTLREDENPHESGLHSAELIESAPQKEGNYIKVKKIL